MKTFEDITPYVLQQKEMELAASERDLLDILADLKTICRELTVKLQEKR